MWTDAEKSKLIDALHVIGFGIWFIAGSLVWRAFS